MQQCAYCASRMLPWNMVSMHIPTGQFVYPLVLVKPVQCISKSELAWRNTMRVLWEQHVAWTRMTILSIVFNSPDVEVVTNRLLRNATDMGNALVPFYGKQTGNKYEELLKQHLVIAANLVKAANAGNAKLADELEKKWYENADQITALLSSINPYLSKEGFRRMFYEHLALTKKEAVSIISKNYQAGVDTYDQIEKEILDMADLLSLAVIKQFPQYFLY